jgi:hypothetical protein
MEISCVNQKGFTFATSFTSSLLYVMGSTPFPIERREEMRRENKGKDNEKDKELSYLKWNIWNIKNNFFSGCVSYSLIPVEFTYVNQ